VFLADMTGDGLTDLVLAHDGDISYWPYQGYGSWGAKVVMHNPPRFSDAAAYSGTGFDPRRLLLGDVDGDGCADAVYVGDGTVTVWVNQAGNGFADPVTIRGTPHAAGAAIRLADMAGTGTAGLLWTYDLGSVRGSSYKFLDLTGGTKPYLLNRIDNHAGATTTITYGTSTAYATADRAAGHPWQTTLPFPVQVVASTTVTDYFSQTTLTSEYFYHHGYWDGADREFRGFARVDQRDTLTPTGPAAPYYSPPTETRTWFHPGPVGSETGSWTEGLDLSAEYFPEDPPLTSHVDTSSLPAGMNRRGLRYAIRALRGQVLRSELYALDDEPNADRPYQITDHAYALAPILDGRQASDPAWQASPVITVQPILERTSVWERGDEPMTKATITGGYDDYGRSHQTVAIAVPRGRNPHLLAAAGAAPYLTTCTLTDYASRDDSAHYLVDRVSVSQRLEVTEDTTGGGAALVAFGRQLMASPPAPAAGTIRALTLTYYDGPAFQGLPSGQLGDWGLRTRVEHLSLTPAILTAAYQGGDTAAPLPPYLQPSTPAWTADYPAAFRALVPPLGGYQYHDAAGPYLAGWYAPDERVEYDVQAVASGRGLVIARRDPLGNDTVVGYDGYQLLPVRVTDPAGLIRTTSYDYRVLQPAEITDPNGNQSSAGYAPLGMPAWIANTGKPGANEGDTLAQPGTVFGYDLTAWDDNPGDRQPVSVQTTRRINHRWALVDAANAQRATQGLPPLTDAQIAAMFPPDEVTEYPDRFMRKTEFTDGFARLLQTRTQADDAILDDLGLTADMTAKPGPVKIHPQDPTAPAQVVVSGWQTYDNKGRVVQKYEPFYADGWAYQPPTAVQLAGQFAKIVISYDPRGVAVKTVYPDGSEQLLVPGIPADLTNPVSYQPTPWETYAYDNNDNAGQTSPASSAAWSSHWNTPSSDLLDPLGRVIEHTERTADAALLTRNTYDIDGNLLQVTDALGRTASLQVFDLQGRPWRQQLIDAGATRTVRDAAGDTVEQRDGKGALRLAVVDALRRPLRLWARDGAAGTPTLRQVFVYGDDTADSGLASSAAAADNLLGRLYRAYDEAGQVENTGYDLDGNLLEKTRQVLATSVILAALPGPGGDWANASYQADWQPGPGQTLAQHAAPLLDPTAYTTSTTYDALARPVSVTAPLDVDGKRKTLLPVYSHGGALTALTLDGATYLSQVLYNARGQRVLADLGCGIMIRYVYDPQTFRLARLRSEPTQGSAPAPTQDYGYAYDLVGNLLALHDRTPGSGINPTPDQLDRAFSYDPLYRLTSATGRECDIPPATPWLDTPRCVDLTKTRAYTESYGYDQVGNLLNLTHHAGTGGYVREYDLPPGGNGISALVIGSTSYRYSYDGGGNTTSETTSRLFEWDHANQLATFRIQTPNAEPSVYAEYRYDGSGQRVLKIVRKQGGQTTVTTYVDTLFERLTLSTPSGTSSHDTLHILDGATRIAISRAGPAVPGDATPPVAYHLADHLGSSTVVLTSTGTLFNREEYTPYGETSFGSYALKRYRHMAKERDEESGLYYYGARYYSPWLARWTSPDPLGLGDGVNPYRYVQGNPLNNVDPSGLQSSSVQASTQAAVTDIAGGTADAGYNPPKPSLNGTSDAGAVIPPQPGPACYPPAEDSLTVGQAMDLGLLREGPVTGFTSTGMPIQPEPVYDDFGVQMGMGFAKLANLQAQGLAAYQAASELAAVSVSKAATAAGVSAARAAADDAANASGGLTRVGRWMSPAEHEAMTETGMVQEGGGGTTYVAHPADPAAYGQQAAPGSRYVEFDVPKDSLAPAGKDGWAQIPGPNSVRGRLAGMRGESPPQFPQAQNIKWLQTK
jgi:RHS repeat-associated protein